MTTTQQNKNSVCDVVIPASQILIQKNGDFLWNTAVQVMANDTAISMCNSQGNFELNVFMPVCIYNYLQSVRLLADVCLSFEKNCVSGIKANKKKMRDNLHNSLMLATALSPYIGYEKTAILVHKAHEEGLSLKEACLSLGYLSEEEFDKYFQPERMI